MAITTLKTVRLQQAGLDDVFTKSKGHWRTMAKRAKAYVGQFIEAADIHPDDLIPILVPALELDEKLGNHLEKKKLTQKFWVTWFGEYIIDEVWGEI